MLVVYISKRSNLYSVLCLWDIQLTYDWNGIEPYGAYQRKSELAPEFLNPTKYAEVMAILEPERSTQMDISATTLFMFSIT